MMNRVNALLLAALLVSPNFAVASDIPLRIAAQSDSGTETDFDCDDRFCEDIELILKEARLYLLETARPGDTMLRQGPELAIERLHPEFAKRLANAIRAARKAGLDGAGIFSAYRPPVFGVGGFADKYYSLHAYGLAVDMYGIGRPGSPEAQQWHEIAEEYGIVCPYGYRNRAEWNHCQPTRLKAVKSHNPLRETITAEGPIDLSRMFAAGDDFIADVASTLGTAIANRFAPVLNAVNRALRHRTPQESHASTGLHKARRLVARQRHSSSKSTASSRSRVAMMKKAK